MFTALEVVTMSGQTRSFPLQDVSSGYVVQNVGGLDPVKASLASSPFGLLDGLDDQSARQEARNIVINFGFEPDWITTDIESLRRELFVMFRPKSTVVLRFYMDGVLFAYIGGRVESCEGDPFAAEPEVTVSVVCHRPDLIAPDSVVVSENSVSTTTEVDIDYEGSEDTGVVFVLNVDRTITEFVINNRLPSGEVQTMDFIGALEAGDVLTISTIPRNKYATLTRAGVDSSFLWGVSPAANWIYLEPGTNHFQAVISGDPVPYTLTYVPRYGGL